MDTENTIRNKLINALTPLYIDVINESHKHNVPVDSATHFKVVVVSTEFEGQSLVNRHRTINRLLAEQLETHVHALSLHTMTESEWRAKEQVRESPDCKGGDGKASTKATR